MSRSTRLTLILLGILTAATAAPPEADAVPAFARRYKLSCSTCHAPFPRLKPFGEEFAGNGFIIPEQEKERDYVNAGDDLLQLNRTFPVGVRFDAYMVFESETAVSSDLQSPWGLKLLSGGALAKQVGYYFYFYMSERGEVAGVEDAYIHFNDVGGRPLDIMVGQFQTSDPLMKRELRLTFEDYQIYKTSIGRSNNNLAYDRGVMITYDVEPTGTGLAAFVVNGNGKDEAGEDRRFDSDKYKNFGLRLSQDLGEYLRVGYYGYYGEELGAADAAGAEVYKNRLVYHGPDLTVGNGMFDLNLQYLVRRDSNPQFVFRAAELETSGLLAELVISPQRDRSRHYFTLLYNQIDSDLAGHDYESMTCAATYLLARNLRGTVEYTRDVAGERNRGVVGLVSAF